MLLNIYLREYQLRWSMTYLEKKMHKNIIVQKFFLLIFGGTSTSPNKEALATSA